MPAILPFLAESTVFALVVLGALHLLEHSGSAATRHGLLVAAVAKFLLPLRWFFRFGASLRSLVPHVAVRAPMAPLFAVATGSAAARLTGRNGLLTRFLVALWLAGALLALALWLRGLRTPASAPAAPSAADLATLERMSARLAVRPPCLRLAPTDTPPFLAGLLRLSIHIPPNLRAQLPQPEFEAVLLHELAHAKRLDNLSRALVHLVVCLFWFHPLLWWLESRARSESELACDDLVLSAGVRSEVYRRGILRVCELFLHQPLAGRSNLGGPNLKHRLERIMSLAHPRPSRPLAANLPGTLLLAGFLFLATLAGVVTGTPVQAQGPGPVAATVSPVDCIWASRSYPQGTAVRPIHHPELLSLCGNEDTRPKWFKTSESELRGRNTPVIAVDDTPAPQSLACKVTAPEGKFCTCDHLRYSPGSVVGSPAGSLVCPASTGKWQPGRGQQTPWPPSPANPLPLQP